MIYFEGTLDGTDIAGSFDVGSDDKITGMGEYGTGASSGGAIGNPFGGEKFTCTSVALVERFCPYHQCREVCGNEYHILSLSSPDWSQTTAPCPRFFGHSTTEYHSNSITISQNANRSFV